MNYVAIYKVEQNISRINLITRISSSFTLNSLNFAISFEVFNYYIYIFNNTLSKCEENS